MAQTSCVILTCGDRERLAAIVTDRNCPQKHVQRARIILHSGERLPVLEVAKRAGVSRPAVWRWQQRFAEEGIEGLLRDKTRPPGKAPLPPETLAQVRGACPWARSFTRSWTTMPPTSIRGCGPGCRVTPAGCFTSPRPRPPGSTRSRPSSRPWTRRRLKRGDFRSIVDLQAAINRYIAEHNSDPHPFI